MPHCRSTIRSAPVVATNGHWGLFDRSESAWNQFEIGRVSEGLIHTPKRRRSQPGRRDCKALDIEYTTNGIVRGAVVKANWPADRSMRTFARNSVGLLVDETQKIRGMRPGQKDLLEGLPNPGTPAAPRSGPRRARLTPHPTDPP